MKTKIPRIAFLAAVLTAMAGAEASQAETPGVSDSDAAVATVRVLNNHTSAVRVYLQDSDGIRHRLGRVVRLGLQTFEIPEDIVQKGQDVEFIAIPVGPSGFNISVSAAAGVETDSISLAPGQMIDFWLEPVLSSSTATVEG